ncbi:MAG: PilT/PilU family type 4a pilus ATPase [Candidatus Eisenbacteria bacterium]|nr:PilT/PilU family type 4a pilus ATPase [Candidatus Eisenbacteria bacterium]
MKIDDVLKEAVRRQASDVILSAGAPITYHVFGELHQDAPPVPLQAEQTRELVYQFLGPAQRKEFEEVQELDMGFELDGLARFRASVFRQRGTVAAVLRLIPLEIPHYSRIGMPESLLRSLLTIPNGLVLVTGPTGSGKSTTVASYLEYLNTEHGVPKHVVTIEDPIEFPLKSKVCVINQREIGVDTRGYAAGLRSALRQMPNIIFVGEMRDRETIEIALTAAETGNVVISTLSTQSASKTIHRIIDVFPIQDQAEIRTRLALTLKAVISQVLLRRKDGKGRIAAREILLSSGSVSNLIREGKVHQINNVIASSRNEGMVLLDDTLLELYHEGVLYAADVLPRLQDPEKARFLSTA